MRAHAAHIWSTVLACLCTPIASPSLAADFEATRDAAGPDTVIVFAGSSAGASRLSGDAIDGGSTGREISVFGLLSPRQGRFFGDLGLGWHHSRLLGHTTDGVKYDMITKSGVVDLNPGLLLGEHWQAGPLASVLFGTDQRFGLDTEEKNQLVMWGARVNYEWTIAESSRPVRLFAQALTESTIRERRLTQVSIGFMIGMPLGRSGEAVATETKAQQTVAEVEQRTLRISLDPELIFFRTGSDRIHPKVRDLIARVGRELGAAESAFESMEIAGHADQRGSRGFNERLSKRRAEQVASALAGTGIDEARVNMRYFGEDRLRRGDNTPEAWAQNRRVEVVFHGVTDEARLLAILEPLQTLTRALQPQP